MSNHASFELPLRRIVTPMLALSLSTAKNAAIIAVVVLVLLALLSAKIVSSVTQKLIILVVCFGLAFLAYSQRQTLQKCADNVQAAAEAIKKQADVPGGDIAIPAATCKFFGKTISVGG